MEELCYLDLPFVYWEVIRNGWTFNWKKSFLAWTAMPGPKDDVP